MGSKCAHFTCLGTPNGLGSFLEKHIFDPFFPQNNPFSRHFGIFWEHLPRPFPPLSFWLILCVVVPHTHRHHPPKFWLNLKHHDSALIFPHFARACCLLACLLLAACCLLAKSSGSSLDTKEGYKTKTGSTSSGPLTLTLGLTLTLALTLG